MTDERGFNWEDLHKRRAGTAPAEPLAAAKEQAQDEFDELPGVDPKEYHAFIVQRGRSRPSLFLDLRSFDERSGALKGTMLSYPQLLAVDYVDDHTILLDFGMRHVRIEGEGLAELIARLHSGSVSVIQAYSKKVWGPELPKAGPIIHAIHHLGLGQGH